MDTDPLLPTISGSYACRRQVLSSIGAATGAFSMGLSLGWASPAIPQLQANTSVLPGPISDNQAEWVGALVPLGAFLSVPVAGPMMERCGRRSTIVLACIPMFLGWACIALARQVWLMYLGRIITGFAASLYSVVVPVYIAEIASIELRGVLGTLFQLLVVFGLVNMYGLGVIVSWVDLAYGAMAVPCITFITVAAQHETPNWLVKNRRIVEAKGVLRYFRDTDNVSDELDELIGSRQSAAPDDGVVSNHTPLYRDKIARKIIFYMLVMMLTNQLCGANVVITFTDSIFHTAGVSIKPELAGFTVGLVMFFFTILSTPIIARVNRRPLLFTSLAFCSISMMSFGFYFHASPGPQYGWVPIVCLTVFILSFSCGMGPLNFVLLGDFSLPRLAALAATISGLTNWGAAFLMTFVYSDMRKAFGLAGTFWFYGICSASGALFSIIVLPETRGRSFQEIEMVLK